MYTLSILLSLALPIVHNVHVGTFHLQQCEQAVFLNVFRHDHIINLDYSVCPRNPGKLERTRGYFVSGL